MGLDVFHFGSSDPGPREIGGWDRNLLDQLE